MKSEYPKILIIGETFHRNSGGGITLSNLFKTWPKDKLGNAIDYRRKDLETEYLEVFSIELYNYKRIFKTIRYDSLGKFGQNSNSLQKSNENGSRKSLIKSHLKKIYFSLLKSTNTSQFIYSYEITSELIDKIRKFDPDYIYFQPSNREIMKLVSEIHERTKIPLAIHIMDDWPSTIASKGLAKNYWSHRINRELQELLEKCSLFFSISEEMSREYWNRYQKKFVPFHNPVSFQKWTNLKTPELKHETNKKIKLLHAGRIGKGIQTSVLEVAKAVQSLKEDGINIVFQLQSTKIEEDFIKKISLYDAAEINSPVAYEHIPQVIASADILVLCNDFDEEGKQFLRYSMPTKASEYMISKVPTLVYSDSSSAVFKHALEHEWAYTIGDNKIENLKAGILKLLNNKELRARISNNAFDYAEKNYEEKIVLAKFKNSFLREKEI